MSKQRVTVTVDSALLADVRRLSAVEESLSAWVAAAIAEKVEHARGLEAMDEAIADYESEYGPISDEDAAAQLKADRERAIWVGQARGSGAA